MALTRREAEPRLRRWLLLAVTVICLTAASLLFARAAMAWYTTKYEDAESHPAQYTRVTCCQADREWNHIWRPTPINFCSHLPPWAPSSVCSLWDNPLLDERDAFNSWAHCHNNDSVTSYPTTCQTTHP
jgi:hypothetical protein